MSRAANRSRSKSPQGPPPGFPVRLGAVDVGSNAIRFAAADFSSPETYGIVEAQRFPVRLGHEVFLTGRLSALAMSSAIRAFTDFRDRLDTLGVSDWRAVATSAVREASNGKSFLDQVRRTAGLEVEAITGSEEARLVHLAVSKRITLGEKPWLLVDLGGGSVEVSLVNEGGIRWSESHTMGSVRLLEELTASGEDPGRFLALLEEYASTLRVPRAAEEHPAGYIATGGNIETLATLAGTGPEAGGGGRLSMADLQRLIEALARVSYRRRVEEFGLREDRADVILPAALIYLRLGKLIGASEILVPGVGVREGVLLDLAQRLLPGDEDRHLDAQVSDAALTLGRRYQFDEAHGRAVAEFSLSLFDQLRSLHRLGEGSRRILLAAALLHDVGSFVGASSHHKHTLYLLANSGLLGFSPAEILVVANVARYHRKGAPKPDHEHFSRLPKADQVRTLKLAALLRLADALDREHLQKVRGIKAKLAGGAVRLLAETGGDLLLETWSLRRKSDFFEKVYNKKIVLEAVCREEA